MHLSASFFLSLSLPLSLPPFGPAQFSLFPPSPSFPPARPSLAGCSAPSFPSPAAQPDAPLFSPSSLSPPGGSRLSAHPIAQARLGFNPKSDRGATRCAALGVHAKGPGPRPYLRCSPVPLDPIKAAATAPRLAALARATTFTTELGSITVLPKLRVEVRIAAGLSHLILVPSPRGNY
jgi:hypothetical protein